MTKRIAILGSTGSIGRNAIDVITHLGDEYRAFALTGHTRVDELLLQAERVKPRHVAVTGPCDESAVAARLRTLNIEPHFGPAAAAKLAALPEVDVVLGAIVGAAGVPAALAAVNSGKTLALANKEALVVAGALMMAATRRNGTTILPVDSEHSAVFQALACGRRTEVSRVILTASGGPFRNWSGEATERASLADALKHPTWQMGAKVTIDSATMFNKGLEMIEAAWLFGLTADQIDVVVHPQSIVHSMVEFVDGSTIAQLSDPDMCLPIQYALTHPERRPGRTMPLDWSIRRSLDFEPPDRIRFPALGLAERVIREGGTLGAVFNAANEVAVEAFVLGRIRFGEISRVVGFTMAHHSVRAGGSIDDLLDADAEARRVAGERVAAL